MPVSLFSQAESRIKCALTEQHWGENSSVHGWECSIFLNICQQIPLKEQMQQYINVMNKLPGYPHPHLCAAELHCCQKPIKNTLLSLTTAPDDTDEHRLLFISVELSAVEFSLEIYNDPHLKTQIWSRMPSSAACCCRLHSPGGGKKQQALEEHGHFLPTAEAPASDSFIIINNGIHQSSETHRERFVPAITRIESNFGFKSSREMRLKKTYDAAGAAGRQSGPEKHGVASQQTLLSGCSFISMVTFIANLKKYDRARCPDGHRSIKPGWV